MIVFKQFKNIWIQSIAFISIGFIKDNYILSAIGIIIFIVPFINQRLALKYIKTIESVLNKIGYFIKNILFAILFIFVITPIALIYYLIKNEKNKTTYIKQNLPVNFSKMW